MARILVTGIAVHDIVFRLAAIPTGQGKNYADLRREVVGGIAANAAIAIQRLGGQAVLATCLGEDMAGRVIADALAKEGVGLEAVTWSSTAQTGLSAILVDAAGERLLVNHTDPALFSPATDSIDGLGDEFDAVLVDTRWLAGSLASLRLAKARNLPGVMDFDSVPATGALELLAAASHVVFGEAALLKLSGAGDLVAGLRWARQHTAAFLAVTAGERGVTWLAGDAVRQQAAFKVEAVDTLAAGDVFHGAFTLAVAEGQAIGDAMVFAAAVAALKCLRFGGGTGTPTREEVAKFLGQQ